MVMRKIAIIAAYICLVMYFRNEDFWSEFVMGLFISLPALTINQVADWWKRQ